MSESFKGRGGDRRLVTGQGRYASDWNLPGQLYGCFVRSDRAHAEIVSLNVERALAAPGVVGGLTGEDKAKAGFGVAPPLVKFPGRGGAMLKIPHRDVLARERVGFGGPEGAVVGADTPAAGGG